MNSSNHLKYLHPKFWPIWIAIVFIRLSVMLPQHIRMKLGAGIGKLLYIFSKKRRKIANINLALCFPKNDANWRKHIIKQHFRTLGQAIYETAMTWWLPDSKLAPLIKVEGLTHIKNALSKNQGIILLSAHFNCLELGVRALHIKINQQIAPVYQKNKNTLLDSIINKGRLNNATSIIERNDVRKIIRTLKQKKLIWYAPDQAYSENNSEIVSFFGIPAMSNTATPRLAAMGNAIVVPMFIRQNEDQSGYIITITPELEHYPSDDPIKDTARFHNLLENEIKKSPHQYLWVHKRFKRRAGLQDIY